MGLIRSSKCLICGNKAKDAQYLQCNGCGEYFHIQCGKSRGDLKQGGTSGIIRKKTQYHWDCPNCAHTATKKV
ncbi:hypothetical protein BRC72_04870 [Halobacteriales archaeon QH_7_66_36]|nr:MAG: hypothetical protein BRC72_04870 [Halobacteriales archaeon QH_7_66_36]